MNIFDITVLLAVAVLFILCTVFSVRRRKKKRGCCGCEGCTFTCGEKCRGENIK